MHDSPLCSSISAVVAIVGDCYIEAETGFAVAVVAAAAEVFAVVAIVFAELEAVVVAPSIAAVEEGIAVPEQLNYNNR